MKPLVSAEKKSPEKKSVRQTLLTNCEPNSPDKSGLMTRKERADYLRTIRKDHRELVAAIQSDEFLKDWLTEAQKDQKQFNIDLKSWTDAELNERAHHAGFRTFKAYLAARTDMVALYHDFVYAEPFKQLWSLLKKNQKNGDVHWSYAPTPVGVPNKLIQSVLTWHQAPKFTQSERRLHSRKIAAASQALEDLLGQIEPSYTLDGQYSRFRFEDKAQAGALFRAFGASPEEDDKNPYFGTQWKASQRLMVSGIVPLWAVQNIRKMAIEGSPKASPLPAKIRAKAAKKTYFIAAISGILKSAVSFQADELQIGHQLIADVVGILAGTDCTADDVRKAIR